MEKIDCYVRFIVWAEDRLMLGLLVRLVFGFTHEVSGLTLDLEGLGSFAACPFMVYRVAWSRAIRFQVSIDGRGLRDTPWSCRNCPMRGQADSALGGRNNNCQFILICLPNCWLPSCMAAQQPGVGWAVFLCVMDGWMDATPGGCGPTPVRVGPPLLVDDCSRP
jgi:hypothetical protein